MKDSVNAVGRNPTEAMTAKTLRLIGALRQCKAVSSESAVTDRRIAPMTGLSRRELVDLPREAARLDVAILATCGESREGRRGKGRYLCDDPAAVRRHGEDLHRRAAHIHERAWAMIRLAERMEARHRVESTGQRRLFGE